MDSSDDVPSGDPGPGADRGVVPALRRATGDLALHLQAPGGAARQHPGDLREDDQLHAGRHRAQGQVRGGRYDLPDHLLLSAGGSTGPQLPQVGPERLHAQAQPRQPQVSAFVTVQMCSV